MKVDRVLNCHGIPYSLFQLVFFDFGNEFGAADFQDPRSLTVVSTGQMKRPLNQIAFKPF